MKQRYGPIQCFRSEQEEGGRVLLKKGENQMGKGVMFIGTYALKKVLIRVFTHHKITEGIPVKNFSAITQMSAESKLWIDANVRSAANFSFLL